MEFLPWMWMHPPDITQTTPPSSPHPLAADGPSSIIYMIILRRNTQHGSGMQVFFLLTHQEKLLCDVVATRCRPTGET
jgi:hypothetical protein